MASVCVSTKGLDTDPTSCMTTDLGRPVENGVDTKVQALHMKLVLNILTLA